MENNEYEIVEKTNKKGMTISKGDKSIEMSPEVSMQIFVILRKMINRAMVSNIGFNNTSPVFF